MHTLVLRLYCLDFQMFLRLLNAHLALLSLALMSLWTLLSVFESTKCTPGFVEPSLDVSLDTAICTDHTPEISELFKKTFKRFSTSVD